MNVTRPLEGVTVAETDALASLSFCGKYLAALGAAVTVADEEGRFAGDAALRAYLDDGKTTAAPDRHRSELVDVLLTTTDHTDQYAATDRQIVVVFSDFGPTGPRSEWAGSDLVAQAAGGLLHLIGSADAAPVRLGGHQLDYAVGLAALSGVMIALHARARTGRGQRIDVSRLETTAYIEWKGSTYAQAGADLARGESSGPIIVGCADGAFGLFYRPGDWPAVLDVIDSPALREERFATQQNRMQHLDELVEAVSAATASLTRDELYRRLQARGVPAGPVLDARDLLESPQNAAREFWVPLAGAGADVVQPGLPFVFNDQRPTALADGAHTYAESVKP